MIKPDLLKLIFFFKQISFNLAIFGKNKSNFREKKCFSVETVINSHR